MRGSTLFLFVAATIASVQAQKFPEHLFTIRAPEPCDQSCRDIICQTEGSCEDCGTGVCTTGEQCGTWAGKKEQCCIQPYNFGSGDKVLCSDAAGFLENLDVSESSTQGTQPTQHKALNCPDGQVFAGQNFLDSDAATNLTCCPAGKDVVAVEGTSLSLNQAVLCVDVQGGGSGQSKSGGSSGSGAGKMELQTLVIVLAAGLATLVIC